MSIIHGKDIRIFSGSGALIAGAKSCTIHKNADYIEVASATNSDSKHYIAGRKGWSIDLEHFVTSGSMTLQEGQTYNISVRVYNSQMWQGTALCTDCDIQASMGSLSRGSIKLLGTGPLS